MPKLLLILMLFACGEPIEEESEENTEDKQAEKSESDDSPSEKTDPKVLDEIASENITPSERYNKQKAEYEKSRREGYFYLQFLRDAIYTKTDKVVEVDCSTIYLDFGIFDENKPCYPISLEEIEPDETSEPDIWRLTFSGGSKEFEFEYQWDDDNHIDYEGNEYSCYKLDDRFYFDSDDEIDEELREGIGSSYGYIGVVADREFSKYSSINKLLITENEILMVGFSNIEMCDAYNKKLKELDIE